MSLKKILMALVVIVTCEIVNADVDTRYPYVGPIIPIGDFIDTTIEGNGKGFKRLKEPPAVVPSSNKPTNNINVIATAYIPNGINIHFQTPFGLGSAPTVKWGTTSSSLTNTATGKSTTYARTPSCSLFTDITMCSEFFHDVQIGDLQSGTTYYYQIQAANGTTQSSVLSFNTTQAAGNKKKFTIAVLNDMGYTNAAGTYKYLVNAANNGDVAFAWHGGDISYADDWYEGFIPCELNTSSSDYWPVCYNGTNSQLANTDIGAPFDDEYNTPLPAGEIPNQGGPQGGDMSPIYETNWDLWQQWLNNVTLKIPYMVLPGNHEATCAEFDGPANELSAYLDHNKTNATQAKDDLTYYSCPVSQRNFTAYQHRFRMPGDETGGVSNFWYSFDYGLAHFVSFDGETDFPKSPEYPFASDLKKGETQPTESETYPTDSGPFGYVGNYSDFTTYQQYKWLVDDLSKVDRCKTPWVIAMSHRPMYSSQTATYQKNMRAAFENLFIKYGVDAYLSGHIHWYERLLPLGSNGTIDHGSVVDNNTYRTNQGKSITHIINGMAGNIESHSQIDIGKKLELTQVLDQIHFGYSKLTIYNETTLGYEFIKGVDGTVGDHLWLLRPSNSTCSNNSTSSSVGPSASVSSNSTVRSGSATVTRLTSGIFNVTSTRLSDSKNVSTAKVSGSASGNGSSHTGVSGGSAHASSTFGGSGHASSTPSGSGGAFSSPGGSGHASSASGGGASASQSGHAPTSIVPGAGSQHSLWTVLVVAPLLAIFF